MTVVKSPKTKAPLQETTLQKHLEVTNILRIFLKKFCELQPRLLFN
jgi:hypothetical protein